MQNWLNLSIESEKLSVCRNLYFFRCADILFTFANAGDTFIAGLSFCWRRWFCYCRFIGIRWGGGATAGAAGITSFNHQNWHFLLLHLDSWHFFTRWWRRHWLLTAATSWFNRRLRLRRTFGSRCNAAVIWHTFNFHCCRHCCWVSIPSHFPIERWLLHWGDLFAYRSNGTHILLCIVIANIRFIDTRCAVDCSAACCRRNAIIRLIHICLDLENETKPIRTTFASIKSHCMYLDYPFFRFDFWFSSCWALLAYHWLWLGHISAAAAEIGSRNPENGNFFFFIYSFIECDSWQRHMNSKKKNVSSRRCEHVKMWKCCEPERNCNRKCWTKWVQRDSEAHDKLGSMFFFYRWCFVAQLHSATPKIAKYSFHDTYRN